VHLSKLTSFSLAAIMSLAIVIPAFAQSGENKDFQGIQDERDQRKLKSLIEDFVGKYPTSQHRPEVDVTLMGLYSANKDWAQMVKHADSFAQAQGAADPKSKSMVFTLAMEAARQMGSANKMNEFADRALTADPNNIGVLMTLARNIAENPPTDAAARTTALDKAMGYAQRAQKVAKPTTVKDDEWQGTQGRLHGILGLIYSNKNQWPEAGSEFSEYLKTNPGDGLGQYRYGAIVYTQLQTTLATLQAVNTDARAAQAKSADDQTMEVYIKRLNSLNTDFETQRDVTIDAMAKALAIGGPFATQARQIIEPLYKQKNKDSMDGLDAFILAKKAEIAALAPVAPVTAPQARTGGTAPAGGAGAAGGTGGAGGGRPGGR
jgi:tetratricopeptide (TPR) repeat protein